MAITAEQKVGVFFLLSLITLGGIIELVEDWHPFEEQRSYYARFDSVVGLNKGDPVRLAGVQVGKVEAIAIEDGHVRVDFYVIGDTDLRQDTVAEINRTNLLGGIFLGLQFGSPDSSPLEPGSMVRSREIATVEQLIDNFDRNQDRVLGALGDLIEESQEKIVSTVENLELVSRKIAEGEGTLGRLVNDPALYEDLRQVASSFRIISGRLERGEGSLGRLLEDPALYDQLAETAGNLQAISEQIKSGRGTLGRLVYEDGIYREASETLNNLGEITAKINRGEGFVGKLVNEETLYQDLKEAVARIRSITAKIDEGEGSLGKLVNEDTLYRDARTTINKVEKAVDGIGESGPITALGTVLGTLF